MISHCQCQGDEIWGLFRGMLLQSSPASHENTLEAPVHQSSPHYTSFQSRNLNLSLVGGRRLSPHQTSGSGIFCRICHEGDVAESLLSPCSCSGSVGFVCFMFMLNLIVQVGLVHRSCLEKWLSSSQYDTCELCRYIEAKKVQFLLVVSKYQNR